MTAIGVAVNGYGVIGKRVADAVRAMPDLELVGVADVPTDWQVRTAIGRDIPVFAANQRQKWRCAPPKSRWLGGSRAARVGRRPDLALRMRPEDDARPKTFPHTRQRQERL